jgi:hypothetical protein
MDILAGLIVKSLVFNPLLTEHNVKYIKKMLLTHTNTTCLFLNNQPDALIIPILFCYKTLHVLGSFSVHHWEFSTVHSVLVSFMRASDDRFQAESGCPKHVAFYNRIKLG